IDVGFQPRSTIKRRIRERNELGMECAQIPRNLLGSARQMATPIILARPIEGEPCFDPVIDPELELLARWMDSVFEIPGLGIRFGLDAIIGLIPGLGDTLTSL